MVFQHSSVINYVMLTFSVKILWVAIYSIVGPIYVRCQARVNVTKEWLLRHDIVNVVKIALKGTNTKLCLIYKTIIIFIATIIIKYIIWFSEVFYNTIIAQ